MDEKEITQPSPAADAAMLAEASGFDGEGGGGADDGASYTVDTAIECVGLGRYQFLVLAMAGLCYTADAMEMLLISFVKPPMQCLWGISDVAAAMVTTSVGVGMLFGSVTWGLLADSYGRRSAFLLSVLLTFFFGLVSALSPSYGVMVLTRGIVGFGIGGVPIAFSLIMEFLPRKARGTWGVGIALFWSIGAVFEALLAMLLMPTVGFRGLIGASTAPLGLLLLLTPWIPESPRWLVSQGRLDAATTVLARAATVNRTGLPPGQLVAEADAPTPRRGTRQIAQLLRPGLRGLTLALWIVWFASAFVYYGAVLIQSELLAAENLGRRCGYAQAECKVHENNGTCSAQTICSWQPQATAPQCIPAGQLVVKQMANATKSTSAQVSAACKGQLRRADYIAALWATSGELPGTLLTLAIVDVIGRRATIGYLYMISAATFAALIPCPGRVAETGSFFVMRAVTNGVFQAVYLYTNEVYSSDVRATGMGVASAMARIGLILTPMVSQWLANVAIGAAISIYVGVCLASVLAVRLTPIETKGRPLLNTTDELVAVLGQKDPSDENYTPFKNDPNSHPFFRFFRWSARVDGRGS